MEKYTVLLKTGFHKIVSGFFLGIGFGTALVAISSIAAYYYSNKSVHEDMPTYDYNGTSNISKIEILNHKDTSTSEKLIIIGALTNNQESKISSLTIEAEFFKDGEFVEECSEYISTNIGQDEIENFKISCGGCGNYTTPDYNTYKITVKSAN